MFRIDRAIKAWKESVALNAHINLYGFWNEWTFLTKSGDLGMVLRIPGVDYESLDSGEQEYAVKRLESALKTFGPGFHVYQYLFKRNRPEIPFTSYDDPIVETANDQRRQFFESKRDHLYQVEIFYSILLEGARSKTGLAAVLARLFRDPAGAVGELKAQFTNGSMKTLLRSQIEHDLTLLEQRVQAFTRQLADFMQIEIENQQGQLRFFRRLLNYDEWRIEGRPQAQQLAAKERELAYNSRFASNLVYSRPADPPPQQQAATQNATASTGYATQQNPYSALSGQHTSSLITPRAAGDPPPMQTGQAPIKHGPEVNIDSAVGQPYVVYEGLTMDTVLMNRLDGIQRAKGTRAKIRNLMSAIFHHAMRYEWIDTNPIKLVRQSAKRERTPDVLELEELQLLLTKLATRERTLVLLDAATGLRVSELLALRWEDVDFENLQLRVIRSIWHQVVGDCKTEASAKPVPLDSYMADDLFRWRRVSPYAMPTDWIFASPTMRGKQPYWPDNLMKRYIRPVAQKAGIHKRIGWHTFRHTFGTLLKANGEDIKTVQELLRHANSRITLEVYTQAVTSNKRAAQSKVVKMMVANAAATQVETPVQAVQ